MATASGKTEGKRRPVMPFVAYGLVLALLGLVGVAVCIAGRSGLPSLPGSGPAPALTVEAARPARSLKLPPRPAEAERTEPGTALPVKQESAPSSLPQTEPEKKPEPPKTECKVDLGRWPADKTDQARSIQLLLRDLGLYRGTTNGTVGPATRTAIREFQLAAGEAETGEPSEVLFEALKKKCAAN